MPGKNVIARYYSTATEIESYLIAALVYLNFSQSRKPIIRSHESILDSDYRSLKSYATISEGVLLESKTVTAGP